jgi:hypothetical protein
MSPADIIRKLALELRGALDDTPSDATLDPEEVYQDLACRLVLRLSRQNLTIMPGTDATMSAAAVRIFDIFTEWLKGHPERHFVTGKNPSGKFEVIVRERGETKAFFQGESIQDAYGQATQVISFNGGSIDEEQPSSRV